MDQNKDRNITSSQTGQSIWFKSKFNFQWIIILLCLSPLSILFSLKDGQVVPYKLFGVLSVVFVFLIIALFFTVHRFKFNKMGLSKENLIPFSPNNFVFEVRYSDINVIEYATSIKGNTLLIIHYVQESNAKKICIPISKNKVFDIKNRLTELGYNDIKFKV